MPLKNIFRPQSEYELMRLGRNNDGGYLISKNSLSSSEYLIALGIGSDWSFEKDFNKKNQNTKIFCYDSNSILKYCIKSLFFYITMIFKRRSIFKILSSFYNIIDYFIIRRKFNFIEKEVSYNFINEVFKDKNNIFLKIDIEGSEYRILDEILIHQEKVTGMVVEFHFCDIMIERIEKFIEKFNLKLIHIHANNSAFIDLNGDPCLMEITFCKDPKVVGSKNILPHKFDMKNSEDMDDIKLNFLN